MTLPEMIFDGFVWLIGASVLIYMLRRYWIMFKNRNTEACGSSQGSCNSCSTGCDNKSTS
jgi:hypothetical protein